MFDFCSKCENSDFLPSRYGYVLDDVLYEKRHCVPAFGYKIRQFVLTFDCIYIPLLSAVHKNKEAS